MIRKNILVVDEPFKERFNFANVDIKTPMEYILDDQYEKNSFVYNLSSELDYQEVGYYVSLLAMAREDKIYPTPKTFQDLKDRTIQKFYSEELSERINSKLRQIVANTFELSIYFGKNLTTKYDSICWDLFRLI